MCVFSSPRAGPNEHTAIEAWRHVQDRTGDRLGGFEALGFLGVDDAAHKIPQPQLDGSMTLDRFALAAATFACSPAGVRRVFGRSDGHDVRAALSVDIALRPVIPHAKPQSCFK